MSGDGSESLSRRSVIQAAAATGVVGFGTSGAAAESPAGVSKVTERGSVDPQETVDTRTVSIRARGDASYSFGVTGVLVGRDAASESVSAGEASARLADETHEFAFSGEFTSFETTGDIDVVVDGETFDVDAFPTQSLTIVGDGAVDISASGRVEAADLRRESPRRLTGTVSGQTTVEYAGELTHADVPDGARLEKNGQTVSVDEVLPSALPGEIRVSGRSEVTVRTSDTANVTQGRRASVEDGAVTATGNAVARYDGNVEAVEHENGAVARIVDEGKRVVCEAPDDASATFEIKAPEKLVHNYELKNTTTVTVGAGEVARIKYYGYPSGLGIDGTSVSFDGERHPEAIRSAKLQLAAEFERTDAYDTVANAASGRVRHDAQAIRTTSITGDSPRDTVLFELANVSNGDYGVVAFERHRGGQGVSDAGYEIQTLADDGYPAKLTIHNLSDVDSGSFTTDSFERDLSTTTADGTTVNAFEGQSREVDKDFGLPDLPDLPDLPSPGDIIDFFGDKLDDFADAVGAAKEDIAGVISGAIENAQNVDPEDFVVKSGMIIVDSQEALIEFIAESQDKLPKKTLSKVLLELKPGFAGTLADLGQSGALGALEDGNYGCAGCLGILTLLLAVGVEATAWGTCTALSLAFTPIVGGVLCTTVVGVIIEVGVFAAVDAREFCGDEAPEQVNFC